MNANRIAAGYRWLEYLAFGAALENARSDFLSHAAGAQRVLILGEGDGRFVAQLLRSNSHASVAVVETSARMIDLARRRLTVHENSRVEFYNIDAVSDSLPAGLFDMVVTHFFLDVLSCNDAEVVISKVMAVLVPRACWLVSEFRQPDGGFRRMHAGLWLRTMYGFFAATTGLRTSELPPYRDLLQRVGLNEIDCRERRFGLIRSQVWRQR